MLPASESRAIQCLSESRFKSEPTVSRLVSPLLFAEKSQETNLTAPEGARGSKLLLLDGRCDYFVVFWEYRPADLTGGRGVTTGPSASVGFSSYSTGTDAA